MTHESSQHAAREIFIKNQNDRWLKLCERFLPVVPDNSIWRFSTGSTKDIPRQGWKLHISATLLTANTVFEEIAPWLQGRKSLFKAPCSLTELQKLNCGLYYGYSQVGKFITVYPRSEREAVFFAKKLHALTSKLTAPTVPFDYRFKDESCVHYRYGSFGQLNIQEADGTLTPAIQDASGNMVPDARYSQETPLRNQKDPFVAKQPQPAKEIVDSPLKTTFRAFCSLTQRGKGGVYHALDFSTVPPRQCILKEGRRLGEVGWDGRDGRWLVKREKKVLQLLSMAGVDVPAIYSSFEAQRNFYLALEYINGESLLNLLLKRRRRLSVIRALKLALQIANLLDRIHAAGWAWRDLKPANVIVTRQGAVRPLDFEGACPIGDRRKLVWATPEFSPPESKSGDNSAGGEYEDYYAFGAILFLLLSGRLRDSKAPVALKKIRPTVPDDLCLLVEELLDPKPQRRPNIKKIQARISLCYSVSVSARSKSLTI